MDRYDELIEELEETDVMTYKPVRMMNRPSLISINSSNGETEGSITTGYFSFTVDLPLPALDVDSLQLLSTNIPQANANIPDTACVFWYYRLSEYSGKTPNINNLFCVRLLPSFYNPEFIINNANYGINRTFKSYKDAATELAKITTTDLGWVNNQSQVFGVDPYAYIPFLANDISLTYNSAVNKFQMTGTQATIQPAFIVWDSGRDYNTGDIVSYNGRAYISLQDGNGDNQPDISPASWKWQPQQEVMEQWSAAAFYQVGMYVAFEGSIFKCGFANQGLYPPSFASNWNSGITYYKNAVVNVIGVGSFCALTTNTNNPPALSTLAWRVCEWSSATAYLTGFICQTGGTYYTCIKDVGPSITNPSLDPSHWSAVSGVWNLVPESDFTWYRYLPTGFSDPNVALAQGDMFYESWNTLTLYNAGTKVLVNGVPYIANYQNMGQNPTTSSAWTLSSGMNNVRQMGLAWYSKKYDMTANYIYYPFPENVGGQPFNPNPKRLLNTILGFTWNGLFTPSTLSNIPAYNSYVWIPASSVSVYNKLRPVPAYVLPPTWNPDLSYPNTYLVTYLGVVYQSIQSANINHIPTATLGIWWNVYVGGLLSLSDTASTTQIYTAEGYCNLVYSSIISIYTNIVGTSTVDTQRTTNLLALVSMNCGNLGVSFWNNFIDNPLTKVMGDIRSIYIEFRDEFGEPYFLTNNAVSTLVFKVAYKD